MNEKRKNAIMLLIAVLALAGTAVSLYIQFAPSEPAFAAADTPAAAAAQVADGQGEGGEEFDDDAPEWDDEEPESQRGGYHVVDGPQ